MVENMIPINTRPKNMIIEEMMWSLIVVLVLMKLGIAWGLAVRKY
jgi:uncharacterized membrane protein